MQVRRAARRVLPLFLRWRLRLAARLLRDRSTGVRFARARQDVLAFPYVACRYDLPLVCYPGQEANFPGKLHNIELALASVHGLSIDSGETFSFWRCVGRPTASAGYRRAAALKDRRLTEDVGGAICFASTLLYNAGLLAGMEIIERRCHSVDSYGAARYFELGRDAAVEYPYVDLRFRNDTRVPLLLTTSVINGVARVEVRSPEPWSRTVALQVSEPVITPAPVTFREDLALPAGAVIVEAPGSAGVTVRTLRRLARDGVLRTEDLGVSRHYATPRVERRGAGHVTPRSADTPGP